MWTSEQGEHERAINDIKYPKPKCRIAYCGKNVEPFNDMLCFQHTQSKNPMEEKSQKCMLAHCRCMQLSPCNNHHYSDCRVKSIYKDCPNKGKVGGCPICFITHHGEKDFQEDKDWAIEFDKLFVKITANDEKDVELSKTMQALYDYAYQKHKIAIKSFIKKTKQESYEEGKKKGESDAEEGMYNEDEMVLMTNEAYEKARLAERNRIIEIFNKIAFAKCPCGGIEKKDKFPCLGCVFKINFQDFSSTIINSLKKD